MKTPVETKVAKDQIGLREPKDEAKKMENYLSEKSDD